jgi:uncharacterized protein (TIGR03089 family)
VVGTIAYFDSDFANTIYRSRDMPANLAQTVVEAFWSSVKADPTSPLVTFYDDASGERVELSGATLANWVAKTANMLMDGLGLGPGDIAVVRLPPHWQTAAVLLGCWNAGICVDVTGSHRGAVGFVAEGASVDADETYALSLAPLGLPFRPGPPAGTADFVVEVRPHGDAFTHRVRPEAPALADGTTQARLVELASAHGLPTGSRVLVDGDRTTDPLHWLVAPLVAGASVVLCRHTDASRLPARLEAERATPFP